MIFPIFLFVFLSMVPITHQGDCSSSQKQEMLDRHNYYRGCHGVPPLDLDSGISSWALEWANKLGSSGTFDHRRPNKYGENLWMMSGSGFGLDAGTGSVKSWYDEIKYYRSYFGSQPNMGYFHDFGHFTALIWKDTQRVGFGCYFDGRRLVVVANYDPPGNMQGSFRGQVLPPIE